MDKNLKTVFTGATILVGVIGLYFVGKALVKKVKAKNVVKRKKKVKDELGLGEVSPAEQTEEQAAKNYNPVSDTNTIYGYIGSSSPANIFADETNELIARLTNAQLKKVAAVWKKRFKKSLYKSLDARWDSCGFFANCYESSMTRLSGLGLR